MDKNAIKKYAVWARRELISRVSQKALQYGISDKEIVPATATSVNGVVLSAEEMKQRKALIDRIDSKGYEQVMEEVAYTWFNRFIALRFMEVNGYLPSRVRVFTDENNAFAPQILTEAISLELDGLDMEKVYALKDANDNEGLFKYLIIVQCNALSPILPRMFQRISDYTELLFPDNLLREGSAIEQMIAMIPEVAWKDAVQIIGWLYQYYNSEKKDEVFAALKKNVKITKENIPAATQLFTPDWIVRYMVENSLGRLWVEGHPNEELRAGWKYYLDEAEQEPAVQTQLAAIRKEYASITPEQIKCIDPCAGSGHILAYMFDVLIQIYEAYGYTAREAVRSIVENNIYGVDIDDRAAQLAYFAVMMKARQYDRRFLTHKDADGNPDVPQPCVYAIVESNGIDKYALDDFVNGDARRKTAMDSIMKEMRDAKEYGSILNISSVDFDALYSRFDEIHDDYFLTRETILTELLPLVQVAQMLSQKYDVVVTNPPYMGASGMSAKLSDFVKKNYPDTKSDMSTVCMEKTMNMCNRNGYMAMINIPVWMFLSSYEKLRNQILRGNTITNMVHPGRGIFGSDFGTTTFVISKYHVEGYTGIYRRLFEQQGEVESIEAREQAFLSGKGRFIADQTKFFEIPGAPIAYWISKSWFTNFSKYPSLRNCFEMKKGTSTGDNGRFIKSWYEVSANNTYFSAINPIDAQNSQKKWFPINTGGERRKWHGNRTDVVNWYDNGHEMKENATILNHGGHWSRYIVSPDKFFTPNITWSAISSSKIGARYSGNGFAFSSAAMEVFGDNQKYTLALINSVVAEDILKLLAPTINFGVEQIGKIPFILYNEEKVNALVDDCISISRFDWDSFETSWDFRKHPLVPTPKEWTEQLNSQFVDTRTAKFSLLSWHYDQWVYECQRRFDSLKENEEELNRIFIEIYGLQDELTSDVEDKDVTVRLADKKRDIKSLISYAVGCMFGRYSLDAPGLIYAGGNIDEVYQRDVLGDGEGNAITFGGVRIAVSNAYTRVKAGDEWVDCTIPVDADNIIPICDDEYFADDIVSRFIRFIETVYGKDTLQENLRFIADALGGSGQPKDVIRNYFLNDFYADHLKIYQKRPIYWLFDSGKKGGFRALVYMHRYQPDTIARMRTDYVHEQQARYRTAIADLEQRMASASTSERVKLSRHLKKLQEQATEIQGYEEKIHHLADQYIAIDLDDGVKKNYEIFKDVLAKIK